MTRSRARLVQHRWAMCLAAGWAGGLLTLAAVVAPAAFSELGPARAGPLMGHLLTVQGHWSLLCSALLYVLLRPTGSAQHLEAPDRPVRTPEMLWVFAALFFTVLGDYALRELVNQAQQGQGAMSFATLHRASVGVYALKTLCVMALAWRLTLRRSS